MKVYIIVDMEGLSGVARDSQCERGAYDFALAEQMYIADANAAALGALDAGAEGVFIAGMHGGGYLFPIDKMLNDKRVRYVMGRGVWPRYATLEDVGAVFLVGYHAKAGTPNAVLDHTWSPGVWQRLTLNGVEIGETGMDAAIAGHFGVPAAFVTGDDKVCAEARDLLGNIETVQVKEAVGRERAILLPPPVAQEMIREGAQRAFKRAAEIEPLRFEGPFTARLKLWMTANVDNVPVADGVHVRRIGAQTVQVTGANVLDVLQPLMAHF